MKIPSWRRLLRIREWPLTTFIVVAVVMVNILLVTYYFSYRQIRESDAWVTFTQRNISDVLEFSTALQEAIVAQHSYLSLGRQNYREMAIKMLNGLPTKLAPLIDRIKIPDSQNELAEMQYETDALVKMGNDFIMKRANGDLAGAYDPKRSESFFALARHIQQNADRVRNTERQLLNARTERAADSQSSYVTMMLGASIFSLIVVVIISSLMLKLRSRQEVVEDELREARERLSLAIKGTSDGIWDWNPLSNEIYISPRLKEIYGYQPHEMLTTREAVHAHIHPEDKAALDAVMEKYLNREIPKYETVFRIHHRDGSVRWIMSRGAAQWNGKGQATRMVGVHTDVSSLKQMEIELREAKSRADTANRAKTDFLASMSHEIRTPMNAIIGISGILEKSMPTEGKQREYINALSIASRSLFALINDLLDLSKLDDGQLLLEQLPFDIRKVLEEAAALQRVRAEEKNIRLSVGIDDDMPQQLIGDPHRLRQIITNLLSNAIKFTDDGSVTLLASLTPVGHLEIRVKDTGIGIPITAQKTIFEKFTQSDPSITRRFGGTGLGLTICRELADLMGGDIEVISTEGKGSEFIITLPLPAAESTQPLMHEKLPTTHGDNDSSRRGNVLLVEDYMPNALVARTVLLNFGFGCEVAGCGQEAVDILTSDRHDDFVAVLMDVQLPDISGVDATLRVREFETKNSARRVPIIAMTAHALMGDKEKFIEAGMDSYIPKPFDPDDLSEQLHRLALKPAAKVKAKKAPAKPRTTSAAAKKAKPAA
jgi:PAS domain S-box-containing protein